MCFLIPFFSLSNTSSQGPMYWLNLMLVILELFEYKNQCGYHLVHNTRKSRCLSKGQRFFMRFLLLKVSSNGPTRCWQTVSFIVNNIKVFTYFLQYPSNSYSSMFNFNFILVTFSVWIIITYSLQFYLIHNMSIASQQGYI